jgi:hypothetical protein
MYKKKGSRHKYKGTSPVALAPTVWGGLPMLQTVRQLNERCFALLASAARSDSAAGDCQAVFGTPELWAQVDARAYERAGRCPVLLVDLNFQHPEWWNRIRNGVPPPMSLNGSRPLVSHEAAAPLLHEILMQAWSLARAQPRTASLLFGMAPPVTEVFTHLSTQDIDRVVTEHAQNLRPRWEDRRTFWTRLLQASVGTEDEVLIDVQLHCLQLLGGELLPRVA